MRFVHFLFQDGLQAFLVAVIGSHHPATDVHQEEVNINTPFGAFFYFILLELDVTTKQSTGNRSRETMAGLKGFDRVYWYFLSFSPVPIILTILTILTARQFLNKTIRFANCVCAIIDSVNCEKSILRN